MTAIYRGSGQDVSGQDVSRDNCLWGVWSWNTESAHC